MDEKQIRAKAMCLLILDGHVLVANGSSMKSSVRHVEPSNFYRVIGGSMEFNETAEDAVRREVREEIHTEIEELVRLDVVENRFVYAGEPGHEIIFLYKGVPQKKDWDMSKPFHIVEDSYEFDAVWIPFSEILKGETPLYPAVDYAQFLS